MKRKKYIKKIMALGYSRNIANHWAMLCRSVRIPYAKDYSRVLFIMQGGSQQ